jgi:hypothetical protein
MLFEYPSQLKLGKLAVSSLKLGSDRDTRGYLIYLQEINKESADISNTVLFFLSGGEGRSIDF